MLSTSAAHVAARGARSPCGILPAMPVAHAVTVRPIARDDESAFLRAVDASRRLHDRWIAPPASPPAFGEFLDRCSVPEQCGFVFVARGGALAGYATLGNIHRHALQSAYVAFAAFSGHEGRGLMRAGLDQLLDIAFGPVGLHRVEANVQPANERSSRLVERLGLRLEGRSPRYLLIDGGWRDHDRWAITIEERRGGAR